jgi:L-lysine exporter family protein LysE/ArgO
MLSLAALKGFLLMCGLIIAIGPQNSFMLRQAVRRERAWLVATIMLSGDVFLILLSGFGLGKLLEGWVWVKFFLTSFGAIYIFRFGFGVFRQMLQSKTLAADAAAGTKDIIATALAVTFLNPHVILDALVPIGTVALQFQGTAKIGFMLGAMAASSLWFFGVAWIGQRLAPFLSRPDVWRMIDGLIVLIMLGLAIMLGLNAWEQGKVLL